MEITGKKLIFTTDQKLTVGEELTVTRGGKTVAILKVTKVQSKTFYADIVKEYEEIEFSDKLVTGGEETMPPGIVPPEEKVVEKPEEKPEEVKPETPVTPAPEETPKKEEVTEKTKEEEKPKEEVKPVQPEPEPQPEKEEPKKEEIIEKKPEEKKKKLAIVKVENKTSSKDENLASLALEGLMEQFTEKTFYEVIERDQIEKVLSEQAFVLSFGNEKDATKVGQLVGADVLVVGSVSFVTLSGKPLQAVAGMKIRGIDVKTGKILFAKNATGSSGPYEAAKEALIAKALEKASAILIDKVPGFVLEVKSYGQEVTISLGKKNGVGPVSKLMVYRGNQEIGKFQITKIQETNSLGYFVATASNAIVQEGDLVLNPDVKDDPLPKSRGKKSYTFLYMLVAGGVAALIGGGSKKAATTAATTPSAPANVPPVPPSP